MAGAKLQPTRWPAIYRRGDRYVYEWTDAQGVRRRGTARTLEAARAEKRRREEEARRGGGAGDARQTFAVYAREWVERYQGRGRKGFRKNTRDEYRRDLQRYALTFWGAKVKVSEITPRHVSEFVAWLCDEDAQRKRHEEENRRRARELTTARATGATRDELKRMQPLRLRAPLADDTVRRILAPVRACLGTAMREGVIMSNPAMAAALPHRPNFDADDEELEARPLSREQLATFLAIAPAHHRMLFSLLAATGLRISEAIALQWRHLHLDGDRPHLKVRRAFVKGEMGPPKSKYGKRDVPLSARLVDELCAWRATTGCTRREDVVFPARPRGHRYDPTKLLDQSNLRSDALVPTAQEADVPWAGFHTFRHTCASMLFERNPNPKVVQRWLGHHSPEFTLSRYVHLLEDDLGAALELPHDAVEGSDWGRVDHDEPGEDQGKSHVSEVRT